MIAEPCACWSTRWGDFADLGEASRRRDRVQTADESETRCSSFELTLSGARRRRFGKLLKEGLDVEGDGFDVLSRYVVLLKPDVHVHGVRFEYDAVVAQARAWDYLGQQTPCALDRQRRRLTSLVHCGDA